MMKKYQFLSVIVLCFFIAFEMSAQDKIKYQVPPKEIVDLIDAIPTPAILTQPQGEWILVMERPNLPSIEVISREELRIGGIRIDPQNNSLSRFSFSNKLKLILLKDKSESEITGLPADPKIENVNWSPDGQKLAFTLWYPNGIELWAASLPDKKARALTKPILNVTLASPYEWLSDSKSLIVSVIDEQRGKAPERTNVPMGPIVRENKGKTSVAPTYQDLLKNSYDEALFKYYTTAQLMQIGLDGTSKKIGSKAIIDNYSPSPDGKYILIQKIAEPFSYLVPYNRFPMIIEIWDMEGNVIKKMAELPLADDIPITSGSVRKGPRSFTWRSDAAAKLYWVEAQDEGNAGIEKEFRDKLLCLSAPFTGQPKEVLNINLRFSNIQWGNGDFTVIRETWRKTRKEITSIFSPSDPAKGKTILFDRSSEDAYNNPGIFVSRTNESGERVLLSTDNYKTLYLFGQGASVEGNRPFVDKYDVNTKKSTRLWRSEAPFFETPVSMIDPQKEIVISRRESVKDQPNYFLRDLKQNKLTQVTNFPHPYKNLQNINKQLVKYKRNDGVDLLGTLYLPNTDPEKNKNLPVIMWAYPAEYKSADAAGQVKESPYTFDRIGWSGPLVWLTQGYAVFDNPAMPIIGEGKTEPNDTYIQQLTADAKAAVDILVSMGVADKNRIAVGGHSYGAFMTANLLAHTDFFAAGIARSGAYNRTLTPFGFQAEDRTLWGAPDTYLKMSPFMYADKIKAPLLMIHGEADDNTGTFPIQSERFYNALMGHGATVRLVMLPNEPHGYRARESVLHVLWETNNWMEKYVKNRKVK